MRRLSQRKPLRGLKCSFCQAGKLPDYKDYDNLQSFVSDRGKIIPRIRTGTCAKHQRRLSRAIKRARYLGLISFVTRV